jgi:hypothetical protein
VPNQVAIAWASLQGNTTEDVINFYILDDDLIITQLDLIARENAAGTECGQKRVWQQRAKKSGK